MKLFYSPGSCSLLPHIALNETGLPFSLDAVNLANKTLSNGSNYLEINPNGMVPALLLDDGTLLTEGPAIVQYLSDLAPQANLIPALGSIERYKAIGWLNFVSTELHKSFGPVYNPSTPENYRAIALENIKAKLSKLDAHFENSSFLLGDSYCIADAYLFTVINWTHFLKIDIKHLQNLTAFMHRMIDRPAIKKALATEGLDLKEVW